MGLDIHLETDNPDLRNIEWNEDHHSLHSLSRVFCNLMRRRHNMVKESELDQIGRLTGVDIAPLYEMDSYPEEMGIEFQLSVAKNEAEKQNILQEAEAAKARLAGNVDRVMATVEALLYQLPNVDNLPSQLKAQGYTEQDYIPYFSNFMLNTGDGYIGNNLGQDLRNFIRYLHYTKDAGSTTVFFWYG